MKIANVAIDVLNVPVKDAYVAALVEARVEHVADLDAFDDLLESAPQPYVWLFVAELEIRQLSDRFDFEKVGHGFLGKRKDPSLSVGFQRAYVQEVEEGCTEVSPQQLLRSAEDFAEFRKDLERRHQ